MCNNAVDPKLEAVRTTAMLNVRMTQSKRILSWLILATLATLVAYFGIRGYLSPELLLNFSNTFTC